MDEYEQAIKLKELWTRSIMVWGQVFIPLGAAIVAFFASQTATEGFSDNDFWLLLIGWFLFTVCMVYWRLVVHHIDEQIAVLYPVILKLEQKNNWQTHTRYFFNNLSVKSRRRICHEVGLESLPKIYDDFVDAASEKGFDHYTILFGCWRRYHLHALSDRGHKIQYITVFSIVVLFLGLILSLSIGIWALTVILLFVFLYFWGKHCGW